MLNSDSDIKAAEEAAAATLLSEKRLRIEQLRAEVQQLAKDAAKAYVDWNFHNHIHSRIPSHDVTGKEELGHVLLQKEGIFEHIKKQLTGRQERLGLAEAELNAFKQFLSESYPR